MDIRSGLLVKTSSRTGAAPERPLILALDIEQRLDEQWLGRPKFQTFSGASHTHRQGLEPGGDL